VRRRSRGPKPKLIVPLENNELPLEAFPALQHLLCKHGFVRRVPGIELSNEKDIVVANLDHVHREVRRNLGLLGHAFAIARQIHGREVAVIDSPLNGDICFEDCDALITNQRNVCLGVYVADCCALYLVDRKERAIGLVHSGRKGTEFKIASNAIALMQQRFAVESEQLVAQLSPCIRPPHYEIDFAAEIVQQCRAAGVKEIYDSGLCTACHLEAYYSYRAEKGRTGRMLALLAL
jgi:purine-nucleoside/S-methyl-5'-thioadenosine phosphorylase / adenosine deaminase